MGKVRQNKNIALIGMPGAYKSTVGKLLASEISYMAFDSDEFLEFERGMSVSKFIDKYGIDIFRNLEAKCISDAVSYKKAVISTGGGAVLDDATVVILRKYCIVIYLYATPKTLYKRIGKDNSRPLLQPNSLEKLQRVYEERKRLYENCAHITINTNKLTSKTTVLTIIEKLREIHFFL